MERVASVRRKLACDEYYGYFNAAHIRVGYMPRPLPALSGRVQGRLCRSRQLSGSSLILEVPCKNSASCAIKPITTKVENAGTVVAPCRQPQTQLHIDAPQNTFVRGVTVAKTLPETLWLLVGSVTAGGTGERRRSHLKTFESSFLNDLRRGDGSLASNRRPETARYDVCFWGRAEHAWMAGMERTAD